MKRSRSEDRERAIDAVAGVYRDLEQRRVERDCVRRTECCRFQLTGMTPYLTRGEAIVAARAVRRTGRTELPQRDDGACPLLDVNGNCCIYAERPFGCRTHFCVAAGGPYSRSEVIDLIRTLEDVDRRLGGDGPRSLPAVVAWALRHLD